MRLVYIITLLLVFASCYTKKKAIEKFCKPDTLTVTIHDTIRTETIKTDTFFHERIDSVTLIKERLKITYKRVNDTIYLSGECLGDTIYLTKEIQVPVTVEKSDCWPKWWLIVAACIGFSFAALIVLKK